MNKSFLYPKHSQSNILLFTTTRFGGSSEGAYKSFNLGFHTTDTRENLMKNYQLLKSYHDIKTLMKLNQIHSNIVHTVTQENSKAIDLASGDGFYTKEPNVALTILTADCFPIVLFGKNGGIANLHAGWRGLNSRIIENAILTFKKNNDEPISAYVGVGICQDCYVVKDDMLRLLDSRYEPDKFTKKIKDNQYKLDLKGLVISALTVNNIKDITSAEETTCCSDKFFSYRRDNGITGRIATVVMKLGD